MSSLIPRLQRQKAEQSDDRDVGPKIALTNQSLDGNGGEGECHGASFIKAKLLWEPFSLLRPPFAYVLTL